MSRKLTNEIIDQCLSNNNRTVLRIGEYISAHVKILWKCTNCDNIWNSSYANISSGKDCPECARLRIQTKNTFTDKHIDKKLINDNKNIKRIGKYLTARQSIKWECIICKHEWVTTPDKILRGTGCPTCATNKRRLTNEIVDSRVAIINNKISRIDDFINTRTKIQWKCDKDHIWEATPDRILAGTGCPKCNMMGTYRLSLGTAELQITTNLYLIRFVSKINDNSFIKIGITKQKILTRFAGYTKNYDIEILYNTKLSLLECINTEQKVIQNLSKYQYIPEGKFGGKTECFIDIPEVEKKILQLLK